VAHLFSSTVVDVQTQLSAMEQSKKELIPTLMSIPEMENGSRASEAARRPYGPLGMVKRSVWTQV
jgi:hypothetical protein